MAVFITVVNPPWRAVQRVPSANNPLSASACPRDSSATGANRASLALPLPRQPLQLNQDLLNVLHAVGNAVGHGRWNGLFIVTEAKPCALQLAQPLRHHPRRVDLSANGPIRS